MSPKDAYDQVWSPGCVWGILASHVTFRRWILMERSEVNGRFILEGNFGPTALVFLSLCFLAPMRRYYVFYSTATGSKPWRQVIRG